MVFEFKLPDLGEGIHEGEILKWYVAVGDTIAEDESLVDIETDKAAVTIPSPKGGTVVSLGGNVGDTVDVGMVITTIDDGDNASSAATPAAAQTRKAPAPEVEATPASAADPASTPRSETVKTPASAVTDPASTPHSASPLRVGPVPAAPATRRKAREMGLDLHMVPGSGPAGRVSLEDLERFAAGGGTATDAEEDLSASAGAISPGETGGIPFLEIEALPDFRRYGAIETKPVRSIRRKVAKKMTTSMILVPHVALMEEVDVTQLETFRRREKARREGQPGGHLSLLSFVTKAVTECLKAFPEFNASLDHFKGEIVYKTYYNIGIAADTPKGLMVPVIRGTDSKSILQIAADIERLGSAARDGKIAVADLQGGSFTITNVGPIAGKQLIPTINHPEVAILGMGRADEQAVVRDGDIVIRTILPVTLTFDHRIVDGADAARFMKKLVMLLSEPLNWLTEL